MGSSARNRRSHGAALHRRGAAATRRTRRRSRHRAHRPPRPHPGPWRRHLGWRPRAGAPRSPRRGRRREHAVHPVANSFAERLERAKRRWLTSLRKDAEAIQRALRRFYDRPEKGLPELSADRPLQRLVRLKLLVSREALDAWGHGYRTRIHGADLDGLQSSGPDGVFDTADDVWWTRGSPGRVPTAAEEAAPARAQPLPPLAGPPIPGAHHDPVVRHSETLLWEPDLPTDAHGNALLTVPLPAGAGEKAQVVVLATARDGRRGLGQATFTAARGLAVELLRPPALIVGDETVLSAVVSNPLTRAGSAALDLAVSPPLEWLDPRRSREVEVPPGGAAVERFRVRATAPGAASLRLTFASDDDEDEDERDLDATAAVAPDALPEEAVVITRVAGPTDLILSLPENALRSAATLRLRVFPGVTAELAYEQVTPMQVDCFVWSVGHELLRGRQDRTRVRKKGLFQRRGVRNGSVGGRDAKDRPVGLPR